MRFRAAPLYIDRKKVAEINEVTMKLTDQGERQEGLEEILGRSDGIINVEFTWKTVIPVRGMQINMEGLMLNRREFSIGFVVGGKTYAAPCRLATATTTSTSKTGTVTGDYMAENSGPVVQI